MVNVTARVEVVEQPPGGFIPPRDMIWIERENCDDLGAENIPPYIVGLAVDYLTRFVSSQDKEVSFRISMSGAIKGDRAKEAEKYLSAINGLDDESIQNCCRIVCFDSYVRTGKPPKIDPMDLNPDTQTCSNIRTMVNRMMDFLDEYGPVVKDGFMFHGGYTKTVDKGDGDLLTKDTLWDIKVSKYHPNVKQTLQILMYYIMGMHSFWPWFQDIEFIGIFNPRLNMVYRLKISEISEDVIKTVERDVIGYGKEY